MTTALVDLCEVIERRQTRQDALELALEERQGERQLVEDLAVAIVEVIREHDEVRAALAMFAAELDAEGMAVTPERLTRLARGWFERRVEVELERLSR